jgi:hypothetical protein
MKPRYSELIKALVSSDYRIVRITGFQIKIIDLFVKLYIQKFRLYILYINNDRNPRSFDYTSGSEQAVTALHLSPPRETGPLIHKVMLHKNSFLLQGSKMIRLNL